MEKVITLEEQLIRAHDKDLKIIQKVCIILMAITFAVGLVIGIFIGINIK